MNKHNIQVITHLDLDGVVSYLVLCWLYGRKLDVIGTTPMKLEQDYDKLLSSGKQFDKLFFLDLDVSKIGNKVDKRNVFIFDHHQTNIYRYEYATTKIYNETSCAKLLYELLFKSVGKQVTSAQKTLIALADDWDSATKSTPLSEDLNIVYHSMSDKFNSFVADYYDGFKPFDKFKQNSITLYKKDRTSYINSLNPFFGTFEFEGKKDVKVGAVFCDKFVQECCDWLLEDCEIAIAVLLKHKRIAVRRKAGSEVDVSKFVQRIAGGGGHAAAAGGPLTEDFMEFTKLLNPLN